METRSRSSEVKFKSVSGTRSNCQAFLKAYFYFIFVMYSFLFKIVHYYVDNNMFLFHHFSVSSQVKKKASASTAGGSKGKGKGPAKGKAQPKGKGRGKSKWNRTWIPIDRWRINDIRPIMRFRALSKGKWEERKKGIPSECLWKWHYQLEMNNKLLSFRIMMKSCHCICMIYSVEAAARHLYPWSTVYAIIFAYSYFRGFGQVR